MMYLMASWLVAVYMLWVAFYTARKSAKLADPPQTAQEAGVFVGFDTTNWCLFVVGVLFMVADIFQTISFISR